MAYQPHRTPAAPIRRKELSADVAQTYKEFEIWLLAHRGFARATVLLRLGFMVRATAELGLNFGPTQAERYIAALRSSGASYAHVHNAICGIEDYLAFLGTPISLARPRKPVPLPKNGLNEVEIAMILIKTQDLREKAIIATLAFSGIRNNEFCNLRIKDIDLADLSISVHFGKGVHNYRASITGECAKLLGDYIRERMAGEGVSPNDWLFITKRWGYQLQTQDIRKIVRIAVRRAGITKPVSPHLFRHSLAMNMLNRGAHPVTIQQQLGHANLETTLLYLRGEYTRGKHEYSLTAPRYI